jgi:hypothetical protein
MPPRGSRVKVGEEGGRRALRSGPVMHHRIGHVTEHPQEAGRDGQEVHRVTQWGSRINGRLQSRQIRDIEQLVEIYY